jgi:hypothetical protein
LNAYLQKGLHWDFQQIDAPVIEEVTWEKVANKCQNHSVGLKFYEVANGERVEKQDKLKKIQYIDRRNNREGEYQIIVEPALTNVMQSDKAHHQGALLIQDHGMDNNNPFIVNSKAASTNELSSGRTTVKLHDFYVLWGLMNMPTMLAAYESKFSETYGNSGGTPAVVEQRDAIESKEWKEALNTLLEIDDDTKLRLGQRLGLTIEALDKIFVGRNTGRFFKLEMSEQGARYIIPELLHRVILTKYAETVSKHQVLNNATALEITGELLPAYDNAQEEESNISTFLQFRVTYYFPKFGWCYVRSDFVAAK